MMTPKYRRYTQTEKQEILDALAPPKRSRGRPRIKRTYIKRSDYWAQWR